MVVIARIMRNSLEQSLAGLFAVVFVAVVVGPWMALWLRTRAWPIAGERELTFREAMSAGAGPIFLWLGIVASGLMAAVGLFILIATEEIMGTALVVTLSGAVLGFFVWLLRARRRG